MLKYSIVFKSSLNILKCFLDSSRLILVFMKVGPGSNNLGKFLFKGWIRGQHLESFFSHFYAQILYSFPIFTAYPLCLPLPLVIHVLYSILCLQPHHHSLQRKEGSLLLLYTPFAGDCIDQTWFHHRLLPRGESVPHISLPLCPYARMLICHCPFF